MTPDGTSDHQLHRFLAAARARLRPEDIGIRPAANRRGGGLHQSDLADALVVSDRWYNGFENGARPPSRYDALVSRLGVLLRLTPAERLYLHLLATGHEPAPPGPDSAVDDLAVRPVLQQLLALLGPDLPAIACDIAWNVIAWNQPMTDHLAGDATVRPGQSNVITWLFTDDAERIIADLGHAREAEIGNVLLALARHPGDQRLQRLAGQLHEIPAARRLWDRQCIPDDPVVGTRRVRLLRGGTHEGHVLNLEFPGRLRLLALVPGTSWLTATASLDGHRRLRKRTTTRLGLPASA
jgi:MmyB-like transcription regulator ligand binding domain/Helix-turn-helix domain